MRYWNGATIPDYYLLWTMVGVHISEVLGIGGHMMSGACINNPRSLLSWISRSIVCLVLYVIV